MKGLVMRLAAPLVGILMCGPVSGHEFWISPERYQIESGTQIIADIRVGENLSGSAYPFIPNRFHRFEILLDGNKAPVESDLGDRPALNQTIDGEGLAIVVHETADSTLTYREWEKFVAFTNHKDFAWAQTEHKSRDLPETGFREAYRRYAKALIAIGTGAGSDVVTGLETEIVALANPYTDDLSQGLPVRVLHLGEPRPNAQVELFAKDASGNVEVTLHRTDATGTVSLPVAPGKEYLADAVVLLEETPEGDRPVVWRSLWASLTFRVPDA